MHIRKIFRVASCAGKYFLEKILIIMTAATGFLAVKTTDKKCTDLRGLHGNQMSPELHVRVSKTKFTKSKRYYFRKIDNHDSQLLAFRYRPQHLRKKVTRITRIWRKLYVQWKGKDSKK